MAARNTPAPSADDVRAWGKTHGFEVKDRGRLGDDLVEAFNKKRKNKYVSTSKQPTRVVKLAGKRADKTGRNRSVQIVTTVPEVRAWAQDQNLEVGKRGRIPQSVFDAFAMREAVVKTTSEDKATDAAS